MVFAPQLDLRGASFGGEGSGAAGEDELVAGGEGGYEFEGELLAFEVDGRGFDALVAVGEMGRGCVVGFVGLVEVRGDIVSVLDLGKADAGGGVIVDVVGITVHVEELAILAPQAGVGDEDSFIVLGRLGVGYVVRMAGVVPVGPGHYG